MGSMKVGVACQGEDVIGSLLHAVLREISLARLLWQHFFRRGGCDHGFTRSALFQAGCDGPDEDRCFIKLPDLSGCATQGHKSANASVYVDDALRGRLELGVFDGESFNPPSNLATLHV